MSAGIGSTTSHLRVHRSEPASIAASFGVNLENIDGMRLAHRPSN